MLFMMYGGNSEAFLGWKLGEGTSSLGMGSRQGRPSLQKQLAEVTKTQDKPAKPSSEETCLSPLPDPWLAITAPCVQCLYPALTPTARCGDS